MASSTLKIPCELCEQPVLVNHFVLNTPKGDKLFCCEGCKSIYQLLNPDQLTSAHQPQEGDPLNES